MTRSARNLTRWLTAGLLLFVFHGAAYAQATRTWVSGVGDDVNPCSRTAPCKTFAGAISKTAAGGEINVLDPGGFGGVTITKSITINGYGAIAGVLVSGTNAIIINAATTDVVVLRNLTIDGLGSGLAGVKILQAAQVHLENLEIFGFQGNTSSYGVWINNSAGTVQVFMENVKVIDNGNAAGGGGIYFQPLNPASALGHINNSQIANNLGFAGLRVDSRSSVSIRNSSLTGNAQHGAIVVSSAFPADLAVDNTVVSGNGVSPSNNGAGLQSQGTWASMRLSNSQVTYNEHGLRAQASGLLVSYGNNMVYGNTTDGAVTSTEAGF
jgi:hypothetical protein